MKSILYLICAIALLTSTGCIFWGDGGGRDHSDRGGRSSYGDHNDHPGDVNHNEHLGDKDHQEH
jgi:hypothetical protein